ncbi:MCE family protein [Mycolicibacterium holsaticum]|uniref:Mammalian cell entry protein n=1 Tax=Mycolicibacterium holsaticum TaxID=152142 RepID=A0A1E3S2N4_9MYCO|nr:MCE family protein [Mycolicibacterium holsaticum]ODQ96370.1 mammalian cell entry protein [Mycolicibacterium holsaticum]
MKSFAERNPLILCAVGIALTVGTTAIALNYDKLPLINQNKQYSAYFEDAGGLTAGAPVEVSGFRVGKVESLGLDNGRVIVAFNVDNHIRLGDKTEAAINTKTLLGAKLLKVMPRGDGHQVGPIPIERTRSPYQLPDALGDLASTISGLDTDQLSQSLAVLSNTFKNTPSSLKRAVDGVGRLADTLDRRDAQLRNLLVNADRVSAVLAEDSDHIVTLVTATNTLLESLHRESSALDAISNHIARATSQVQGLIADNRDALKPALDKLNGALVILDTHKEQIQESIKLLNAYAMSLGEATSSGPFFKSYLANLLPGQFVQPFVDAAFSDLGLDPNTLLPSQLTDPQVGQPATPPLPIPYPRTGQGGEPRLTLPDAITGKPGDPRYPYRPPLPAPPPGGPPPGPPTLLPPNQTAVPNPTPASTPVPAPGGES